MSETIALLRLSLACSRTFLFGLLAIAISVVSAVMIVGLLYFGADYGTLFLVVIAQVSAMFGIASIGLFQFGNQVDMGRADSGCNDWLLRMPVDAWKIALVPIALKTEIGRAHV